MTTSFPPINYPNKPVPPFSAEPPRNPFPGFFPDMWKNITGKPYITVSSKGLANGLSEYINDGADFGPDSLQADGSLTQTSGIKEAYAYAAVNPVSFSSDTLTYKSPTVQLLDGFFICTAPFTISYKPIIYQGKTYQPGNIMMFGSGLMSTYIIANISSGYLITIDPTMGNIDFEFAEFQPYGGASPYAPAGFMYYDGSAGPNETAFTNPVHMLNVDVGNGRWSDHSFYFNEIKYFTGLNYSEYGNGTSEIYIEANGNIQFLGGRLSGGTFPTSFFDIDFYGVENVQAAYNFPSAGANNNGNGVRYGSTINVFGGRLVGLALSGNINNISLYSAYLQVAANGSLLTLLSGISSITMQRVICKGASVIFPPITLAASGITINALEYDPPTRNTGLFATLPSPTIPTNPPVSGTVYQNTNPYDIEIDMPVYATTSGTAGHVTIAKGSTSTPTAIGNQFVSGSTSSTSTDIIRLRVPAGWYYEFTGSGVTFGTATPFAE